MVLMPRESAKLIAKLAKNVFIEEKGIQQLSYEILENLKDKIISIDNFSQMEFHPNASYAKAIDHIFVIDTINFSFWPSKGDNWWTVNGQTGYFALCAAIKRALEEGVPILDANFLANITRDDLEKILRGDPGAGSAPLLNERVHCLQQVGKILIDKYNSTFLECVKAAQHSTNKLLKLVVDEFECYRDEAEFNGHKVSFYKRAQILIGDIWACYKGKGIGKFNDIDNITIFADYRIPQVLLHYGALRYSNPLLTKLQYDAELSCGSDEEIEIRGCSIEIVERTVERVRSLIKQYPNLNINLINCNAIVFDHFLWDYRRRNVEKLECIPFHKTRTIFY